MVYQRGRRGTHNIRKLLCNVIDHLVPENHSISHSVALGHIRKKFARAGLGELESISSDPSDTRASENCDLCHQLQSMEHSPVPTSCSKPR